MTFLRTLQSYRFHQVIVFFSLFSQFGLHAQDWELANNSDGIDVYTKKIEGSDYKAFKSEAEVNAKLSSFVAVLLDVEALEKWGYKLKETKLLERKGDTMQVYFAEAKAPFPYSNRYGVYLNEFKWNASDKELRVDIDILEDYDYDAEDLVLLKGDGYWKAKVLSHGKLKITFEMHVDPGRGIPAWLSNLFADESPYETMKSVREEMKKDKYQNQTFDFLKD